MSRHKNIRTMDLDEELDDYDGEDYYEEEEDSECFVLRKVHATGS